MVHPVSAGSSRALASSAVDTTVPAPTIVTASAELIDAIAAPHSRGTVATTILLPISRASLPSNRANGPCRADSGAQTTTRE